jgi:hypothetical protein
MRLNREEIGVLIWLAACACLIFGFYGFAVAVPWATAVYSVGEAVKECPGAIDPDWPAVFCNHSQPFEWKYGMIADHPLRFAVAWVQMIIGWGAFLILANRMKRFR